MTATPTADAPPRPSPRPRSSAGLPARLFQPIDIGLIAFFRIAFGTVMLIEVGRYFRYDWIRTQYIEPPFHFTYYGFLWVRPWPGDLMTVHFTALAVLAVMIAAGLFYRWAAVLFFLGITYVFLLEQSLYLNHMYLICLISFLLIVLPAHRKWSLDARRRPELRSETVPAWTLWLLRFQIGVVYFYGGIAKLDADWLSGRSVRLMLANRDDFPILGPYVGEEWMVAAFVWGGLLFDLLIVPLLLWNRTRTPAFVAAILFHSTNAQMFRIGIFPLFMVVATLLFFPPDSLQRGRDDGKTKKRKRGHRDAKPVTPAAGPLALGTRERLIVAGLSIYGAFQLLMPLRHHLYPGNVNWTEEGHRFAWHMKLRVKTAECRFVATDDHGNRLDLESIDTVLTKRQRRVMAGRPDMALQYAHYLADELAKQGHANASIHAESRVSLNGRNPQPLIDPHVDLAKQRRSLRHADWILPLQRSP
ncbi:MAG: HTTM domain-containing protein [Planctomycetaceae bacterium]